VPALASLLALLALAALGSPARAAEQRPALTLRTSLGPIAADDTRKLRALGQAPSGARLTVRFYRGSRRLSTRHPLVRDGRYRAFHSIDRTGEYVVRVSARLRTGETLRVTARLSYGPEAEAPSAPDPAPTTSG